MTVDADDELIGRNVLKMFNWGYQTKRSGVLYSNYYWYSHGLLLSKGYSADYLESDRVQRDYRFNRKFSHLRSFRNELLFQIDSKDLLDIDGKFFNSTFDFALFVPLMELACRRVNQI